MQSTLTSSILSVKINHFGAEICSIKNKQQTEFIWQADEEWKRHAPVLFPIVGKLKNDIYSFNTTNYKLTQHGFARDYIFKLISSSQNTCTFELKSSPESKINYPFDFIFQIQYKLIENKLTVSYLVINPSNSLLYFSIGAHPAFSCQLNGNDTLNDYYLKFETSDFVLAQLNNGLRTNHKSKLNVPKNKLVLSTDWFDNDALVFENSQINKISLCSLIGNQKITMDCNNWPYFGIWAKKQCHKFICLEPWYGIADNENTNTNLKTKDGILTLNGLSTFNCSYAITIN